MTIPSIWATPLWSVFIVVVFFAIGEVVSTLTKGYVSSMIVAVALFITGFWTGLIPTDITAQSGLLSMATLFAVPMGITNLGTIINLEDIVAEWKTVLIAIFGFVGIAAIVLTVGAAVFGREYAFSAAPPIAGGTIATIIVSDTANAAGRPDLGAFATLVVSCQMFVGIPVATVMIKRELNKKRSRGDFDGAGEQSGQKAIKLPDMTIIPPMPAKFNTTTMMVAKLALVAAIGWFFGSLTAIPGSNPVNYIINPNVAYLIAGLIFCRIGFLEKNFTDAAKISGLIMIGLLTVLPGNFATMTPSDLLEMLPAVAGLLVLGGIGIAIASLIMGKFLGYSPEISIAIGMTAMIGYPGTQIIANECVRSMEGTDEQKKQALDFVMPKMIVGGFTTVTIASVVFAGFLAPLMFG